MGKRVHVVKKHAEYGSTEAFNWKFEEFNYFLEHLGCNMCKEEEVFDEFECDVDEYKKALSLMKSYKKYGKCKRVENQFDEIGTDFIEIDDCLENLGGLDYVLESMQAFYNERDKKSYYISFSAW